MKRRLSAVIVGLFDRFRNTPVVELNFFDPNKTTHLCSVCREPASPLQLSATLQARLLARFPELGALDFNSVVVAACEKHKKIVQELMDKPATFRKAWK